MSDMKREVQKGAGALAAWCVVIGLAAGCASVKRETLPAPDVAPSATTNRAVAAEAAAVTNAPPAEGYAWEALARLAAANCSAAKALLLDAEAERHQAAVDTGWKNPQLRLGEHWGDEEEVTSSRAALRAYPDEVGRPTRPYNRYGEWGDKTYDGSTVGLRVYTANPFVNHWLRKRGAASARALEEESKETAYAVFCEVRSLCLEAEAAREEIALLEQMARFREQTRDFRQEQSTAGVADALALIRAETRLAAIGSEIREKQTARQQVLRRIAVLTGLPVEQLRLRPTDFSRQVRSEYLDGAVLTDMAFMRRPDLTRAQQEKEAAEHGVKAAQAGNIPWFEYVEGTYEEEDGTLTSSEPYVSGHDTSSREESEWQVRVAVTLPVFNWLGDEVRLSRSRLAAAKARADGLYETVRAEVSGVLDDYRAARAERDRLAKDGRRLQEMMSAQIDGLAKEPTVRRDDVLAAREELAAYQKVCLKAERECLRMEQYLETVSGGTLTPER